MNTKASGKGGEEGLKYFLYGSATAIGWGLDSQEQSRIERSALKRARVIAGIAHKQMLADHVTLSLHIYFFLLLKPSY